MIEIVFEILITGCGVITLIALIMVIREDLLSRKLSNLTFSDLPVKRTTYCHLVLDWCHDNLSSSKTPKPNLRVRYYPHKKIAGLYISGSNECLIYINNHLTLREITNTVIHEYVHSRQRSKTFEKMYEKHQREIGYEKNPFEVEARDIAKKYEKECLIWVHSRIYKS
jgi:hypothetical protein